MKEAEIITNQEFAEYIDNKIKNKEIDAALHKCLELSKENTKSFLIYYYLAVIFDIKNNSENAVKCARQAFHNGIISLYHLDKLGHILAKYGKHEEALICFEGVLKEHPNKFECLFNVGITCYEKGNSEKAIKYLEKAYNIEKNYVVLFNLGVVYRSLNATSNAREYFIEAIKEEPNNAEPYFGLASLAEYEGNKHLTKEYYQKGLELDPTKCIAYYSIAMLGDTKLIKEKNYIERINNVLLGNITTRDRGLLNLALGKIHDDMKNYDKAFEYYDKGNKYISSIKRYNPEKVDYIFSIYKKVFSQTKQKAFKNIECSSSKPIFIVGMPRSGTTLTEQILTSHSQIETIGESPYFDDVLKEASKKYSNVPFPISFDNFSPGDFQSLNNMYLNHIKTLCPNAKKIINKTPDNFINIGSILTFFPNATIINCKRHPLGCILSSYFIGFEHENLIYSYHLEDLAKRYKQYVKFMSLWNTEYSGKIHNVSYEILVLKPKKVAQELLSFCNLNWEDACLEFNNKNSIVSTASKWQIRDKIYNTSVFKWKKYEKHLEALKELLKEEIEIYENEVNKRIY